MNNIQFQYQYYDNSLGYHGKLLATIIAQDILVADKIFEQQTNIDPKKANFVGCVVIKLPSL